MNLAARRNAVDSLALGNLMGKDRKARREKRRYLLNDVAIIMITNYAQRMSEFLKNSMHDRDTKLYEVGIKFKLN